MSGKIFLFSFFFPFCLNLVKHPWNVSEKPVTGHTQMQEEFGAGGPPRYDMQSGYHKEYPQPVMAQPMTQQQSNTTVVVTQPTTVVLQQGMRDWNTGLCGCFEDCYSCKRNVTASLENPHVRKHFIHFILYLYWNQQLFKSPLNTNVNQSQQGNRGSCLLSHKQACACGMGGLPYQKVGDALPSCLAG